MRYGETELALDYEVIDTEGLKYKQLYNDPFVLLARKNHPKIPKGKGISSELYSSLSHVGLSWTRTKGDGPIVTRLTKLGIERNSE